MITNPASAPALIDDELNLLAALVPLAGQRIVELGCGNAHLARTLLARIEPQIAPDDLARLTALDLRQRLAAKLSAP